MESLVKHCVALLAALLCLPAQALAVDAEMYRLEVPELTAGGAGRNMVVEFGLSVPAVLRVRPEPDGSVEQPEQDEGRIVCERRTNPRRVKGGTGMLAGAYAASLAAGGVILIMGTAAGNDALVSSGAWFMVPYAGSIMGAARLNQDYIVLGVAVSGLQIAGTALLIAGVVGKRECKRHWSPGPAPGASQGLSVTCTW